MKIQRHTDILLTWKNAVFFTFVCWQISLTIVWWGDERNQHVDVRFILYICVCVYVCMYITVIYLSKPVKYIHTFICMSPRPCIHTQKHTFTYRMFGYKNTRTAYTFFIEDEFAQLTRILVNFVHERRRKWSLQVWRTNSSFSGWTEIHMISTRFKWSARDSNDQHKIQMISTYSKRELHRFKVGTQHLTNVHAQCSKFQNTT